MTIRTSKRSVTFSKPFTLKGINEVLPAGDYSVVTDEEALESMTFLAYRRISTVLHVCGKTAGSAVRARAVTIDPIDLDAALRRDREHSGTPAGQDTKRKALKTTTQSRREAGDRQAIECGEDDGMIPHSG